MARSATSSSGGGCAARASRHALRSTRKTSLNAPLPSRAGPSRILSSQAFRKQHADHRGASASGPLGQGQRSLCRGASQSAAVNDRLRDTVNRYRQKTGN